MTSGNERAMTPTRDQIQNHVQQLLKELARDWDYSTEIDGETLLFRQLGFESLDIVVLGTAIQEHYGRTLPFSQLFTELGERGTDLSVTELVDFIAMHLSGGNPAPAGAAHS